MGLIAKLGLPPPAQDVDPALRTLAVSLAGYTQAALAERIRQDRAGITSTLGDVQRQLALHAQAARTLAPLAAAVEKVMQTPADQRVIEIYANTGAKTRSMGRDAANARSVVRLTQSVCDLASELLTNAQRQLAIARQSLDAQDMTEAATRLREQAAEIAAAFDVLTDVFDKVSEVDLEDTTLIGAGLGLLTWGLKTAAGVTQLVEKADRLDAAAKAMQVAVIQQNFAAATDHARSLARQLGPMFAELQRNLSSYDQQRGEVEKRYDARSQGSFRFAAFEKALVASEASLAPLEAATEAAGRAARQLDALQAWLDGMLAIEGRCLLHHQSRPRLPFEPDPRQVHEGTLVLKAGIRAAIQALAPLRRRVETVTLGLQLQTGDVTASRQRWLAYYDAAQTALFMAPEG